MEKEFDAVKMMREIRDRLHKEYKEHPDLRRKRLDEIRKEYGLTDEKQKAHR